MNLGVKGMIAGLGLVLCLLCWGSDVPPSVHPSVAGIKSMVTITGSGFGLEKGKILINKKHKCKVIEWQDDRIVVELPNRVEEKDKHWIVDLHILGKKGEAIDELLQKLKISPPSFSDITYKFESMTSDDKKQTRLFVQGSCFGGAKGRVTLKSKEGKSFTCRPLKWNEGLIVCVLPKNLPKGDYDVIVKNGAGTATYKEGYTHSEPNVTYRWEGKDDIASLLPFNYLGKLYLMEVAETPAGAYIARIGNLDSDSNLTITVPKMSGDTEGWLEWAVPCVLPYGTTQVCLIIGKRYSGDKKVRVWMHTPGKPIDKDNNTWVEVGTDSLIPDDWTFYNWDLSKAAWRPNPNIVYDQATSQIYVFSQPSNDASTIEVHRAQVNFNLPTEQIVRWDSNKVVMEHIAVDQISATSGPPIEVEISQGGQQTTEIRSTAMLVWKRYNGGGTGYGFFEFTPPGGDFSADQFHIEGVVPDVGVSSGSSPYVSNSSTGDACIVFRGGGSGKGLGYTFYDFERKQFSKTGWISDIKIYGSPAVGFNYKQDSGGITVDPWAFYSESTSQYLYKYGINDMGPCGKWTKTDETEPFSWSGLPDEDIINSCPLVGVIDGPPPTANLEIEDQFTFVTYDTSSTTSHKLDFNSKIGPYLSVGTFVSFSLVATWNQEYSKETEFKVDFETEIHSGPDLDGKVALLYICPITTVQTITVANRSGQKHTFNQVANYDKGEPSPKFIFLDRWWDEPKTRVWNDPTTYQSPWTYDTNTSDKSVVSLSPVISTDVHNSVGVVITESWANGLGCKFKVGSKIKEILKLGLEGEFDIMFENSQTVDKQLKTTVKLNGYQQVGELKVRSFALDISWHYYKTDKKGIDNFWCPPQVRTDHGFYYRPWFLTWQTANIVPYKE